uniref:Sulfotransferase n=1 Tax=Oreochromis niloticus TaxID=8128 RepID=A0A669D846_ORENI
MSGEEPVGPLQAKMLKAKEISDEEKLYRYNGVLYSTLLSPEEHLKCLEKMQAREDDIMLVAYPKCGFNWMVGVMRKIIAAATGVKSESKIPPLMEFYGPENLKVESVLKSNLCVFLAQILVVFRNPKDTMVSFYHFSNSNPALPSAKSWDTFYSQFMSGEVAWGSYFDHALGWEKKMDDPNVMVVTYEEMKQDLSESIRKVSSFYGFSLTDAQVQQIADASTFKAMKESSASSHGNMGNVFFRKGEVGDWKNHFTPEQSREMDEVFNKRLAGTKIGAKLNYQAHCQ